MLLAIKRRVVSALSLRTETVMLEDWPVTISHRGKRDGVFLSVEATKLGMLWKLILTVARSMLDLPALSNNIAYYIKNVESLHYGYKP